MQTITEFDQIIEAARCGNSNTLNQLQAAGVCIDVSNAQYDSPAQYLAAQGELAAAELLRVKFNADVDKIAYGAAMVGYFEYVETLRLTESACINHIAAGAARGGYFCNTKALGLVFAPLFPRSYVHDLSKIMLPLYQSASGGRYFSPAPTLYDRYGQCSYKLKGPAQNVEFEWVPVDVARNGYRQYAEGLGMAEGARISLIAQGAARGGHRNYAESLRTAGASLNAIACEAAQGGYHDYTEELRKKGASINWIAQGAARGGHRGYAEALRSAGANISWMARGAAQGGHWHYAAELVKKGARIDSMAYGAALGGHASYAYALLARGAHINVIAKGVAQRGDPSRARQQENHPVIAEHFADRSHLRQSLWCWLLQSQSGLPQRLNRDLFALITQQAFPELAALTRAEFNDLCLKVMKTFLGSALTSTQVTYNNSGWRKFLKNNQTAATVFARQLPSLNTHSALLAALSTEETNLSQRQVKVIDDYSHLITRYRLRLGGMQHVNSSPAEALPPQPLINLSPYNPDLLQALNVEAIRGCNAYVNQRFTKSEQKSTIEYLARLLQQDSNNTVGIILGYLMKTEEMTFSSSATSCLLQAIVSHNDLRDALDLAAFLPQDLNNSKAQRQACRLKLITSLTQLYQVFKEQEDAALPDDIIAYDS